MSEDSSSSSSSYRTEEDVIPVWELLFDEKKTGKEKYMVLDKLINKKIKVWSVLSNTINGVRGRMKGQVGVLTSFDDEFIVLDKTIILSRKFIHRIEFEE